MNPAPTTTDPTTWALTVRSSSYASVQPFDAGAIVLLDEQGDGRPPDVALLEPPG
jgi:hypothetical protein